MYFPSHGVNVHVIYGSLPKSDGYGFVKPTLILFIYLWNSTIEKTKQSPTIGFYSLHSSKLTSQNYYMEKVDSLHTVCDPYCITIQSAPIHEETTATN